MCQEFCPRKRGGCLPRLPSVRILLGCILVDTSYLFRCIKWPDYKVTLVVWFHKRVSRIVSAAGRVDPSISLGRHPSFRMRLLVQGVIYLPPATKLQQGNVFTPVCHSVHKGGVCFWSRVGGCLPPAGQTPPRQTPPAQCMLGCTSPAQCMLGYTPCPVHARIYTPCCPVHTGIWSTSGRYASNWNAFLFWYQVTSGDR